MKSVLLSVLVLAFVPVKALAQMPLRCANRVALGGAASLLPIDIPVDPVLAAGGRHALASSTGSGLEGSINALLPISARWSVTTEFGVGSMAVEVEREADNTLVQRPTGDRLGLQRFVVGFLGRRSGARSCTYGAIRAGLYRFSYRDSTLSVPGGSAMMGFEAPATGSTAVFFEIELSVALTEAQPPVTPEGIVVQIRPALGLRYRF